MAQTRWISETARAVGGSRNYKLLVPGTLEQGKASPLIMMLHGCTHNADDMAEISGMNGVAEAEGFLVVYPEQSRLANLLKCWNWFDPKHQVRDAGEPSILAAVVGKVCSTQNVDPGGVYLVGVSAGGAMASNLGALYPDLFTAIAVIAGAEFKAATSVSAGLAVMKQGGPDPVQQGQLAYEAMRDGLARRNLQRMPVMVFHGVEDTTVNPVNAEQVVAQWRKTNECLAADSRESKFVLSERIVNGQVPEGYAFRRHIYTDQVGCLLMEKWLVEGLGHAWSGSPKASKYGDPKGPNASAEIWRFFSEAGSKLGAPLPGASSHRESNATMK
jgi:poly(hydroxyalkanoate) depolymerase family esterase